MYFRENFERCIDSRCVEIVSKLLLSACSSFFDKIIRKSATEINEHIFVGGIGDVLQEDMKTIEINNSFSLLKRSSLGSNALFYIKHPICCLILLM